MQFSEIDIVWWPLLLAAIILMRGAARGIRKQRRERNRKVRPYLGETIYHE